MRALLVGEAPACGTSRPFEGNSDKRLRELIGEEAFGHLLTANLNPSQDFPQGVVVLLAGQRLARAYGVRARYFEPCMLRRRICYIVPHPGSTRWYSVEINRARVKRFFLALLLTLEGVERPDGTLDSQEFRCRVQRQAQEHGRVFV